MGHSDKVQHYKHYVVGGVAFLFAVFHLWTPIPGIFQASS